MSAIVSCLLAAEVPRALPVWPGAVDDQALELLEARGVEELAAAAGNLHALAVGQRHHRPARVRVASHGGTVADLDDLRKALWS